MTTGWKRALRALQYRNYRLYFGGQGISLIGTWMQRVAMSWLVYRLTDSAFMLGLIGFAGSIPSFIFGPLAGVLADRYNRRRMLIITQSLALLQAFILMIGGGCCIVGSLIFARNLPVMRKMVRPMYQRMGILPDIDMGIQANEPTEMRR